MRQIRSSLPERTGQRAKSPSGNATPQTQLQLRHNAHHHHSRLGQHTRFSTQEPPYVIIMRKPERNVTRDKATVATTPTATKTYCGG
jgi:hypothetical protein